jgi:hypothetical protein
MCHHHISHERAEKKESDELPSFLNDEASSETELLADGGDDETESE